MRGEWGSLERLAEQLIERRKMVRELIFGVSDVDRAAVPELGRGSVNHFTLSPIKREEVG